MSTQTSIKTVYHTCQGETLAQYQERITSCVEDWELEGKVNSRDFIKDYTNGGITTEDMFKSLQCNNVKNIYYYVEVGEKSDQEWRRFYCSNSKSKR